MASEAPWRSLHPASVVVNLLPTAWRILRNAWPLALAMFWGNRALFLDSFFLFVFVFFPIWRTVLHFLTFRYRVEQGRLELKSGLLNRSVRMLSPDRIQNVELVRNVFHRLSGLVEVRVETASGGDVEGQLSALSEAEAEALMTALEAHRRRVPAETEAGEALVVNTPLDLAWYGLSSVQLGLVAVTVGAFYELSIADPLQAQAGAALLGWAGGSAAIAVVVLGAWLVGSASSIVRHWGFTLTQRGDRLVAEEGLFTQRAVELSTRRVQAVSFKEPVLRRLLGFGTLSVDTAATREAVGGTQLAEAVVPVLTPDAAQSLLQRLFPGLLGALDGTGLTPPHPKALIRGGVAALITGLVLGTASSWFFWPTGLLAFGLIPLLWTDAWLDHRSQGWRVDERHLISRVGWFARTTQIVPLDKLQSLELVQTWFARRWGLAQLRVRVAGTRVTMPWMDLDTAFELELALSERLRVLLATQRGPALVEHEQVHREQEPGDRLGDDAGEDQAAEQQPLPADAQLGVREPDGAGAGPDAHQDHGAPEHAGAERRGLPVEPDLPVEVDPGLGDEHQPVEQEQEPERDL